MLKVMKYDWRNGWNAVRSTLLAAAVVSVVIGIVFGMLGGQVVINREVFMIAGEKTIDYVVMGLCIVWFALMTALLVQTVDAIFRNMVGRMFGPEGYLTHSLPVSSWELLLGKAMGTWIFGVFMVLVAIGAVLLVMAATAASSGAVLKAVNLVFQALPKLGAYHFRRIVSGAGYVLYGVAAFLAWSFLMVIQFQFICIAARQFGRFHVAGGFIVFWLLCVVEGNLNQMLSMGFVIFLLSSAACFYGSRWLLEHRLSF